MHTKNQVPQGLARPDILVQSTPSERGFYLRLFGNKGKELRLRPKWKVLLVRADLTIQGGLQKCLFYPYAKKFSNSFGLCTVT